MNWSDAVFAAGGALLCIAMLPALRKEIDTPFWTACVLTGVIGVFAITYGVMGYWMSAITVGVQAFLWGVVCLQEFKKWRFRRDPTARDN